MNNSLKNLILVSLQKEVLYLKLNIIIQKNLIVQHLPVKERGRKIEINRMRNGYVIDTLTTVDIQEIVEMGGKVVQIFEGVIYR